MLRPIVIVLGLMTGCDDHILGEQVVDPETVPQSTGLAGVQEMVDLQCLGPCHSAENAIGGLDLETDLVAATVGIVGEHGIPIVLAGDPDNSMLYLKITAQQDGAGSDMPPGIGGLPSATTDIVYDWIASLEPEE